ncbi:hypothetical protein FOA52_001458 [Chlamydomonas sp. UWO 241]|nr:hypothetical protein FOA52_001458 [Chlamydomonas sp. UWO 241]
MANDECGGYVYASGGSGNQCCYLKSDANPSLVKPCRSGDSCIAYAKTSRAGTDANTTGMPVEMLGSWLGDEKYVNPEDPADVYLSCSSVIQQKANLPGRRIMSWQSIRGLCGRSDLRSDWFQGTLLNGYGELYMYEIIGWQCLPLSDCDDDMSAQDGSEGLPKGWEIKSKSCARVSGWDLTRAPGTYSCMLVQTAVVSGPGTNGTVDSAVVNTYTYGSDFCTDPWGCCPSKAVFATDAISADVNAFGAVRGILQVTYPDDIYDADYQADSPQIDLHDPCTWSCYDAAEGECCKGDQGFGFSCDK